MLRLQCFAGMFSVRRTVRKQNLSAFCHSGLKAEDDEDQECKNI